ncbi:E3 ubiquitin-protein ligase TRIM39-like [Emys orbicularis]|uniref:E3 ubiquitin-protein ligase TRIM39-like n=1 Tax=Emys orbicularis TaxID=82168 RepID=UPI0031FBD6AC
MAAENRVESLQEEVTCPVCLEYFTEPVTLKCGHNFCRACIGQCWEGSDTAASCPQCRETVQQRNLRPNRQLANVLEIAKRLSLQAAKGAGGDWVCGEHQEALKLFCEEDETPICVICRESRVHCAHTVVPIQEAAQEYKKKIQAHLKALREEREKLLGFKVTGEGKRQEYLVVNVTLDPDTAHPRLAMSEDRKSVRWGDTWQDLPDNPERFDLDTCVLGCEGFTSGKHCWEVVVGVGRFWAVGVARESVRRKGGISLSPDEGIWAVERWRDQFQALTSPEIPLPLSQIPSRIRVCLDCDRGQVTFIDAGDEAPIFTFPPGSIPRERIRPWLWVGVESTGDHAELISTGGAATTIPPLTVDSEGDVLSAMPEDFADREEEEEEEEEELAESTEHSVLPNSQDLFLSLIEVPSQGEIVEHTASSNNNGNIGLAEV